MSEPRPRRLLLVRHGETAWSASRKHTGRSDIPLTEEGWNQAERLRGALPLEQGPVVVWSSPLRRARDTARWAGLEVDAVDDDLLEWDYGTAEGRTTEEIRREVPGWSVWRDGVEGGETLDQVGTRCDAVIERAEAHGGTVVLVAHAHLLRILTARWLGLPPVEGRRFTLEPASWSDLGHERETRVVHRWNVSP